MRKLRAALAEHWGLPDTAVEVHDGGMNSATWFVARGGERWVAKAVVPDARRSFAGGLAVAGHVSAGGIPAGPPVLTRQGSELTDVDGVPLALLTWVAGEGLASESPNAQHLIGTTLARAHAVLARVPVGDAEQFHWVDVDAPHLAVRPWIRPAVTAAVAAYDVLAARPLSWGLLHTDPAPDAFRRDPGTGACGLIDWSVAMHGPLLYDLASAVMYVGGPEHAGDLVTAYLAAGVLGRAEVEHGLPVLLRFRWAVQADYFARRLTAGDLTGIASAADNEKGLADAHQALAVYS